MANFLFFEFSTMSIAVSEGLGHIEKICHEESVLRICYINFLHFSHLQKCKLKLGNVPWLHIYFTLKMLFYTQKEAIKAS